MQNRILEIFNLNKRDAKDIIFLIDNIISKGYNKFKYDVLKTVKFLKSE